MQANSTVGAHFLGVPMQQRWTDLFAWEQFLHQHPVKTILELGTGQGGMSLFLALWCERMSATFATFDVSEDRMPEPGNWLFDELVRPRFEHVDLRTAEGQSEVLFWLDYEHRHPVLLFCDNGDKPTEFSTFVPALWPGDYVAVHDYGIEFREQHHVASMRHMVKPVFQEAITKHQSITAWYQRI